MMEKQIQTAFPLPRQYRRAEKGSIARRLLNVPTEDANRARFVVVPPLTTRLPAATSSIHPSVLRNPFQQCWKRIVMTRRVPRCRAGRERSTDNREPLIGASASVIAYRRSPQHWRDIIWVGVTRAHQSV